MKNTVPEKINALLTMANAAIEGANTHGTTLALNSPADLIAARAAVVEMNDAAENAKQHLQQRRDTLKSRRVAAREFMRIARAHLRTLLGDKHSVAWKPAGFTHSLALPRKIENLEPLLESLQLFLANYPAMESASLNVTAATVEQRFQELKSARGEMNAQRATLGTLMQERGTRVRALRKRMRLLINELDAVLPSLDDRWKAFGLNMPGAKSTPAAPKNVRAVMNGTSLVVEWDSATRAEYYRVRAKFGAEEEFALMGNSTDTDFTIPDVSSNATVQIVVSAVNSGGESAPSTTVSVVSGLLLAA